MPPPPPQPRIRATRSPRTSTHRGAPSPAAAGAASNPGGKSKPILYTLVFAATTIMGTYYGAGLKMQSEATAAQEQAREKSIDEKIEALQSRRAGLVKSLEDIDDRLHGVAAVKELGNGRGTG